MTVRRFNEAGLLEFERFVNEARANRKAGGTPDPVPDDLLTSETYTEPTEFQLPAPLPPLATKMDIGALVSAIVPEDRYGDVRLDKGLWSWLAAKLFDQLTKGRTKIKETRAYLAGLGFQHFYRHLVLGPYYIYHNSRDNPERVRVLLYDDPTTMNEVMVQLGSYQTFMQNQELQTVVQRLYFDEVRKRTKVGSGGKNAGTPRRLMDFFNQILLNYDLNSISSDQFWEMLPGEFDRFKGGETRPLAL